MKAKTNNKLAVKMLIAMIAGIGVGLIFMAIREGVGADSALWLGLNKWLFQDITADSSAIGLFYIGGQLFVRSLQLVIVPMVFTSIILAIGAIRDAATLGRISGKTFLWFFITTSVALVFAGVIALICYKAGAFSTVIEGIEASSGSTGSNPLNVILNIIPSNITATFTTNSGVLALVFLAIVVGVSLNKLGLGEDCTVNRFCKEVSDIIVVFLNFVVNNKVHNEISEINYKACKHDSNQACTTCKHGNRHELTCSGKHEKRHGNCFNRIKSCLDGKCRISNSHRNIAKGDWNTLLNTIKQLFFSCFENAFNSR